MIPEDRWSPDRLFPDSLTPNPLSLLGHMHPEEGEGAPDAA
ncbi:hypothetical protein OP10G_2623 [Fimbriimonas ginsengisoli Gsoil 348]|uniref:Uncharacterized protein n=1 Tax=Fimbriimonas ginsengisoli Gsoil 348 TaxID=661478 RepID=A0A068NRC7_FIMGI|nr:hypothetical protein OP10G_2623 [Fimbriimonas ginsengisoli Gsoil 348]